MPKIKTYIVKASVKSGIAILDKDNMKEHPEEPHFAFDAKDIAKYAQEVANFNNVETSSIEKMGDDDYEIEFKLIV